MSLKILMIYPLPSPVSPQKNSARDQSHRSRNSADANRRYSPRGVPPPESAIRKRPSWPIASAHASINSSAAAVTNGSTSANLRTAASRSITVFRPSSLGILLHWAFFFTGHSSSRGIPLHRAFLFTGYLHTAHRSPCSFASDAHHGPEVRPPRPAPSFRTHSLENNSAPCRSKPPRSEPRSFCSLYCPPSAQ